LARAIYPDWCVALWCIPWQIRSAFSGGGYQGEFGERSSHPKPLTTSFVLGRLEEDIMVGVGQKIKSEEVMGGDKHNRKRE
jgi:hypothetical protein